MKGSVPTEPMFFLKPTTSYLKSPNTILLPKGQLVHHEVELGVVIGKTGKDIKEKDAFDYVSGYALGLDLTARDIQSLAKQRGHPWTVAKGFDHFTPIGDFIPKEKLADPHNVRIWASVSGKTRQDDNTGMMVFKIPKLIEYISSIMTLEKGDLILTGTPKGVGPIEAGDKVVAGLEYEGHEVSRIEFDVSTRSLAASRLEIHFERKFQHRFQILHFLITIQRNVILTKPQVG
ncbi:Acylpyruvase FAHD1, mitochondrial [Zancudomyces culisetae]|uniref:Acylpyruvase FAHD1, mitochondrial n=1 Tax=Zancudomyces culisetae TaxID=1213189 RepID=A0A1R1PYL6_ZANCU|nr:Acylpyruvase FAHD1, mitochondrial [Zancudomyces culisetae]|eukprot:OMH86056.1 Acylpyruvase FAHD1, mitochondrial [Zancudomyces culisetae]